MSHSDYWESELLPGLVDQKKVELKMKWNNLWKPARIYREPKENTMRLEIDTGGITSELGGGPPVILPMWQVDPADVTFLPSSLNAKIEGPTPKDDRHN
jgi:hypothetical protein